MSWADRLMVSLDERATVRHTSWDDDQHDAYCSHGSARMIRREWAMSEAIRHSIEEVVVYLTEHPEEARYTDAPATAVIDRLRSSVVQPNGMVLVSDMPSAVGGGGTAPSPGSMMRAATASCLATLIAMRAAVLSIDLTQLEVTVDSESDDRGMLGMDSEIPAGPLTTRAVVGIASDNASAEDLRALVEWADQHSPVRDAIRRAIPTTLQVDLLGEQPPA